MRNGGSFYQYDWQANRLLSTNGSGSEVYAPNALNQYAEVGGVAPTYDLEGNLLSIPGRMAMAYDAKNQMTFCSNAAYRVWNTYDHLGRRIAKRARAGTYTNYEYSYLYDGWNMIAEIFSSGSARYYLWGLDLSGSLQGAGGIGGLLAASLDGTTALYSYDVNGNVGQLIGTAGNMLAHYEYTPFGEMVVSTGPLAKANPFRFSTKHWDDLTGLGYWGYRYYHPDMGRWLSRDSIWEWRNLMLYSYTDNLTTTKTDFLGLIKYNDPPPVRDPRPQPPTRPLPPPARQPPGIGLPRPPNPEGPIQVRPPHVDPCCFAEQMVGDPDDPMSIILGCTTCWKLCSIPCKTLTTCGQCLAWNPACYKCGADVIIAMTACWVDKSCYQCVDGPIKEIKGIRIEPPVNGIGPIYGIPGLSKCIYDVGCGSEPIIEWVASQQPCPILPLLTRIPKTVPCPQ